MVATANGASIQSLEVTFPFRGAWLAKVEADADDPATFVGTVTIESGATRLIGTALRPGSDPGGQTTLKIVGGAGRLAETIPAASYGVTDVGDVVKAILAAVGERLSVAADVATLALPMQRWNRSKGDAASCLSAVAKANGFSWRVLDDGSVWVGVDAFAETSADVELVASKPSEGTVEVADDDLAIRPGQSFQGARIYEVSTVLGPKATRSTLTTTEGGGRIARADAAKAKRQLEEAGFPFAKTYAGIVTSQNADGTVEVKIDDGKDVHSQSKVPLRHGIHGVTRLDLAPQAQVVLGFDDGDPQKPYAALPLKGGRLLHLTVDADVVEIGGTTPVALEPPVTAWADRVNSAITAIVAKLATPGPITGGPSGTPPGPLTGADAQKLFTE